jgi:hypothetical protein
VIKTAGQCLAFAFPDEFDGEAIIRCDGETLPLKAKAARSARTPKPDGFATRFLRLGRGWNGLFTLRVAGMLA